MKNRLRFRIIEFLYNHKLFGIHRKCWASLVIYTDISHDWNTVEMAMKCGYCGACMTKEEFENQTYQ